MKLKDLFVVNNNVVRCKISLSEIKAKLASYPENKTPEQSAERMVYAVANDYVSLIKGFGLDARDRSYRDIIRDIVNS
jgi:hypothetical protein